MNIVYACSFRNERVNAANPVRMIVTGPAQGVSQKVDDSGFLFQPNILSGNAYVLDPKATFTGKRYRFYSLKWTPLSSAAAVVQSVLNIFGFLLPDAYKKDFFLRKLVIIQDTQTQTSRVYKDGRYVMDGTVQGTITVNGVSPTAVYPTYYLTDLVIGESDIEEGFSASLTDQVLTEVSNTWGFNGTTLLQSVDRTDVTTTDPHAEIYYNDREFTVSVPDATKPLLIEAAGLTGVSDSSYYLNVTTPTESHDATIYNSQSPMQSVITGPSASLTVGRSAFVRNIYAYPSFMYGTPGLLSAAQITALDTYGQPWTAMGASTALANTGFMLHFDATTALSTGASGYTGLRKSLPTDFFDKDWTLQTWVFMNATIDNQSDQFLVIKTDTQRVVDTGVRKTAGISYARLTGTGFNSDIANGYFYLCGVYRARDRSLRWFLNGTLLSTTILIENTGPIVMELGSTKNAVNEVISEFRLVEGALFHESVSSIPVPASAGF